jgi:hypothetical protein|tara:strand:+ start:4917 stop:5387 length:471 start_codon:yes stop_codon:yes gene_type:complete
MTYLKNLILTFLTFFLIFTEIRVNTFLTNNVYFEFYPFLIYLFYVSSKYFSRSSVLILVLNGFYYDIFYTTNFLGETSIKLLLICIVTHFISTKLSKSIFTNFLLFYICLLLYKYELIVGDIGMSLFYFLVICLPNYLLFRALNSNLRRDVFSAKI